ncbi:MAG: MBL fold metallo-hydrolase [Candidatus Mucispirillum faecigallinarum]|nr:MBL fold metallo-hydrolase [Candidatus Mucispirillum faecigallinarum]
MKKLLLIIMMTAALNVYAVENKDCFKENIAGAEVYVCSVKDNNLNTKILVTDSKEVIDYNKKVNPEGVSKNKHNVMIIKKDGNNVLVDTGYPDTINMLKLVLKSAGLEPKDITHVILTHGHYDHIGGLTENGRAVFPNAYIYINENDYNYFCGTGKTDDSMKKTVENSRKIFAPYKDKIKFYKEGVIDEKIKEIKAVPAYGHTPGHSLINISDKNKDLLFVSDLFHIYNVQIKYPKTPVSFDTDKKEAVNTRLNIIKKYKGTNTLITGSHTTFSIPVTWK